MNYNLRKRHFATWIIVAAITAALILLAVLSRP